MNAYSGETNPLHSEVFGREVPVTAPAGHHDDGCSSNITKENENVHDVTVTEKTMAAASACSAIYGLVATGHADAAKYLFHGLGAELRTEVHRIMEADLPLRVAEAVHAGLLHLDEILVDTTTTPASIVVKDRVEPHPPRRQEPQWDQHVEAALVEVLGDRDRVAAITGNREAYRELARAVRDRAEHDDMEAVDVLRRLGAASLDAAMKTGDPASRLIEMVSGLTPDISSRYW